MENKDLTEEQKANVQRDIGLTDCLIRVQALETILKVKGVIEEKEYNDLLESILAKMDEKLKEMTGNGVSNLMDYKSSAKQES
jgi:hypothetical protein